MAAAYRCTYRVRLEADRVTAARPLAGTVEITLAQEDVDYLDHSAGARFLTFATRRQAHATD